MGPLLFLVYIGDVSRFIVSNGSLLLYADDIVDSTVSSIVLRTTSSFKCMHVDSLCGWISSAYLNQTLKPRFESQQEVPVPHMQKSSLTSSGPLLG